jgi:hypothetical protein
MESQIQEPGGEVDDPRSRAAPCMYRGGGGPWDDGQQRAGLTAHRHMHELAGRSGTTAGGGQDRQQYDGFFLSRSHADDGKTTSA